MVLKHIAIPALLLMAVLLVPAQTGGAFIAPVVCPGGNVPLPDGNIRISLCFPSNSAEAEVKRDVIIGATSDPEEVEFQANDIVAALNASRAVGRQAKYQPGQTIALRARPVTPPPSPALQDCIKEARRLQKYLDLGPIASGALLTKIQAQDDKLHDCYEALIPADKTAWDGVF